jgi:hypothetical protein
MRGLGERGKGRKGEKEKIISMTLAHIPYSQNHPVAPKSTKIGQ